MRILWASFLILGMSAGAGLADEPVHAHPESRGYSRWHYWTPTLWRVRDHFQPVTIPMYAGDRYPGIPRPIGIVVFPRPPVTPEEYYRGTGLSYDTGPKCDK